MSLAGFESFAFSHDGGARTVFRRGSGPGVVVHPTRAALDRVLGFFAERLRA
jgi:hypothetical protein